MAVIWKPVVGFEGAYEVSSAGEVRSIDRTESFVRVVNGRDVPVTRHHRGRLLRAGTVKSGHRIVILGRGNPRLIHRLALEAFVGPRPEGADACHDDGDAGNNALDNLRWGTRSDNVRDMLRHGRSRSGLSTADVVQMRTMFDTMSNPQIAKVFGVTSGNVCSIRNGHTWSHAR